MSSTRVFRHGLIPVLGPLALLVACAAPMDRHQMTPGPSPASDVSPPSQILFFDANAASITSDGAAVLRRVLKDYARTKRTRVVVVGHADRAGSGRSNTALSIERAEAVRRHLVSKGMPSSVIETIAAGEEQGLVGTPDGTAEAQNRRAEVYMQTEVARVSKSRWSRNRVPNRRT